MQRLALLGLAAMSGCALNLVEGRPARTLPDGDWQLTYADVIVAPTRVVRDVVEPGRDLAEAAVQGEGLSRAQKQQLIAAATAIALSGPGFGMHLDAARGLPHEFEAAVRLGNGMVAAGVRRGLRLQDWDLALGLRLAYNSGGSTVPYFDTIDRFVDVASLERFDVIGTLMVGREWADVVKLWAGAKAMRSSVFGKIDASALDLGTSRLEDALLYYGGLAGLALGYRWLHVFAELSVMRVDGNVAIFGRAQDLSGWVFTPAWGLQVTF